MLERKGSAVMIRECEGTLVYMRIEPMRLIWTSCPCSDERLRTTTRHQPITRHVTSCCFLIIEECRMLRLAPFFQRSAYLVGIAMNMFVLSDASITDTPCLHHVFIYMITILVGKMQRQRFCCTYCAPKFYVMISIPFCGCAKHLSMK